MFGKRIQRFEAQQRQSEREFNRWFDSLSPDEQENYLKQKKEREEKEGRGCILGFVLFLLIMQILAWVLN